MLHVTLFYIQQEATTDIVEHICLPHLAFHCDYNIWLMFFSKL
jgi:hypothetical protein